MKKKGLPEVTARAVMSLYHEAKTKVRVGSELSEEFLVQVAEYQLSPLLFCDCSECNHGECKRRIDK